jgi:hypothetical protein
MIQSAQTTPIESTNPIEPTNKLAIKPESIPTISKQKQAMVERLEKYSSNEKYKPSFLENEVLEIQLSESELSESELLSKLKKKYEEKQELLAEKRAITDVIKLAYDELNKAKHENDNDAVQLSYIKIEKLESSADLLLPNINTKIEKITEEENVYFEQLKALPKIKKQSVLVEAAKQQTGITGIKRSGILDSIFNDDRNKQRKEVGMKVINSSLSLVSLITATSGIAIAGIGATAATTLIVHTGGVALVGLAIFIGTTIYNSNVIDEYMKYVYSMNTTIALSFNRMRLHYTVLNGLLKEHSINHRMFGQDEYPCDELTEFLETSMYFYQIFFLYLNETVFNDIFLKSQQDANKSQQSTKDKQELETAIQLNNIEYAEQGTIQDISDKIQKIVNKKMEKKKGIIKRILITASGAASSTYRALSINTIKKNLNIALNVVTLSYTNLLSKYTEDYMFALSYLTQQNITIGDIDKLIFISGFGEINNINNQIEDKSLSMTDSQEASEEKAIIEDISSGFIEDTAPTSPPTHIATPTSLPTPISLPTPTSLPTPKSIEAPRKSGFFGWLFGRGGGNKNMKQKSRFIKKRMQKYKNNHFMQLTTDISKIEKLYSKLFPVKNKSRKNKKINKKENKRYSKKYHT